MVDLRFHGDRVIRPGLLDFAVNVWPAPRPAGLDEALRAAVADAGGYPDQRPARAAIARRHRRPAEEVLLANGASEIFWLLAVAARARHAVCVHPSFTEPEAALRAVGVPVTRVLRRPPGWALRPADVPDDADLVVLGNPNNPTGTLDPAGEIASLAVRGRVLVVDEAFIDFVPDERESLSGRRDLPGLVVVRSLTKLWGLAGIRVGYALADADLVALLERHRQPWSVSSVACAALEWCAADRETPAGAVREVADARELLLDGLRRLDLAPYQSAANFLLLETEPFVPARLADRGIAVRPAASFPGLDERFVRIAVRRPPENDRLLGALAEVLDAV
jgi:histidinol-phosphate/aromatic aminotransferase/cobyric acid decarboxylase-like protein